MKGYTGCAKKKLTKVVDYNFACVESFLMKFGYVKFFTKNFKFISRKMLDLWAKI